ncbi:hypothetical protein ASA1KI_01230 [Opitutales bacterium ASA1]|uniref:heparinase II/III domain-containing protein n=1 Tax=Congregicoccus parvus TaxID=3081749 RepID=UPI002B28DC17|nr:hypothetical protein ASA1KI_01230 [Opitutales bacterium ASA1]
MQDTSRRRFLKATSLFAAALPLTLRSADAATGGSASRASGATRGLFFDRDELPRIRAALEHPRLAAVRAKTLGLDVEGETRFLREELSLRDHILHMMRARTILENASFAFVASGERRFLELARLAIGRLLEYERWDYFLEGGEHVIGLQRAPEATIAMLCALDWLGDELVPELRAEMERQITIKGAPACHLTLYGMKYPDRVRGWGMDPAENFPFKMDLSRWPLILNATNLKIIPTCALGMAGAWFHERHPEARKWLEMAQQSARAFSTMYGLDGSYDEGVGYWGYTTLHLVMLAEVLHRRLGIDERALIDYRGSIRFALGMTMPTLGDPYVNPHEPKEYTAVPKGAIDPKADLVNFGDSGSGVDTTCAAWVSLVHDDPVAAHAAQQLGSLAHLPAAVWFRPEAKGRAPGRDLHDQRFSNDWVVSRTGFEAKDSVVAFRSGGPANHEHADRNSVLFKAYGERLFHDPFKAAYVPTHPRWQLRLGPAHTALLIDGKGHQYHDGSEGTNSSWASARITHYAADGSTTIAVSDATEAYRLVMPEVEFVERAIVFRKPDVLVVIDRVRIQSGTTRPVQARFQVMNEDGLGRARAMETGFAIERPFATLAAIVRGSGALTVKLDEHPLPQTEGVYPFLEVASPAAGEHVIVTACTAAPKGGVHGALAIALEGTLVRVTGSHRGHGVDLRVRLLDDSMRLEA